MLTKFLNCIISVCSKTFRSTGRIHVDGEAQLVVGALEPGRGDGEHAVSPPRTTGDCNRCNVFIEAPDEDNLVRVNFTTIYGFTSSSSSSLSDSLLTSLSLATSTASKHAVPNAAATAPDATSPNHHPPQSSSTSSSSSPSQNSQRHRSPPSSPSSSSSSSSSCTPRVEIAEVESSGSERIIDTLCHQRSNLHAPQVFQSHTHLLKLTFEWPSGHRRIGFNLEFSFAKKQGECCQYILSVCLCVVYVCIFTCKICSHRSENLPNANAHADVCAKSTSNFLVLWVVTGKPFDECDFYQEILSRSCLLLHANQALHNVMV